ncbi:hypothetical protein CEXT_418141 [Caerostris extrusa]|uniref:Uncharacterized protein n=1 Tax=Caerostris extrusa TaxID=172846 RepID=A0AAV4WXH9_CAEEX|nr:hypothetical protein CEXT_418141 [Caerostris extrusa]
MLIERRSVWKYAKDLTEDTVLLERSSLCTGLFNKGKWFPALHALDVHATRKVFHLFKEQQIPSSTHVEHITSKILARMKLSGFSSLAMLQFEWEDFYIA